MQVLKRAFDILIALSGLVLASPILAGLALLVRATSPGPAIHWSRRVGRDGRLFAMPKFRTMRTDTPDVATHLLQDPARWLTPVGGFLRRSSLDELPKLWSILIGDMSLVGPRPALFNQEDLIALRKAAGVDRLRPGLTGWAQINGRDTLPIADKVQLDQAYLHRASFAFDLRILLATAWSALGGRGVSH